jgi:murein DD-endopeptidase MepM/ murein hydrolase activator NlpD
MTSLSRTRVVTRTIALAALAAASLGCKVVIEHAGDSARSTKRSDTVVSLPYTRPADTVAAASRPAVPAPLPLPQISTADGDVSDSSAAETTPADLAMLSLELIIPLPGVKASELRDTFNEKRGGGTRTHEALDIMAPRGTPVLSASAGRVLKLHNSKDGGLMVYAADASDRFVLMYAHLDRYAEGMRDSVPLRQGQIIGYVGSTGNAAADAPHLHFAIAHPRDVKLWWTGTAIDPRPLLR